MSQWSRFLKNRKISGALCISERRSLILVQVVEDHSKLLMAFLIQVAFTRNIVALGEVLPPGHELNTKPCADFSDVPLR